MTERKTRGLRRGFFYTLIPCLGAPWGKSSRVIHEKTRAFGHGFLESEELGDSIKTSRATLRQCGK
jgi:hypothetical protein